MKKILLATTLLVGTAGFAAAEVALTGDARMGIFNDFAAPGAFDPVTFTSRARVTFTLSGESDSGLSFGGSFRADNAVGAAAGTAGSVFVSGAFGKLSMGDVDGAANAAVGHVNGVGLTGLSDLNESLFIASGGLGFNAVNALLGFGATPNGVVGASYTSANSALYEFSTGALSLYVSATAPGYRGSVVVNGGTTLQTTTSNFDGDSYSVGAAYTLDAYKFSLGYESVDVDFLGAGGAVVSTVEADHIIAGVDATFGDFVAKVRYGTADIDLNNVTAAEVEQFSLSGTYTVDALAVTAFYNDRQSETPAGVNITSLEALGLGASYDLGGGASIVGGVVQRTTQTGAAAKAKDTGFDLGLSFTF